MNLNPHLSHDKTHKLAYCPHTCVGFSCFMGTFYSRIGSYTVLYKHLNTTFTESFVPSLDFQKTSLVCFISCFPCGFPKTTWPHTHTYTYTHPILPLRRVKYWGSGSEMNWRNVRWVQTWPHWLGQPE